MMAPVGISGEQINASICWLRHQSATETSETIRTSPVREHRPVPVQPLCGSHVPLEPVSLWWFYILDLLPGLEPVNGAVRTGSTGSCPNYVLVQWR